MAELIQFAMKNTDLNEHLQDGPTSRKSTLNDLSVLDNSNFYEVEVFCITIMEHIHVALLHNVGL